MFNYFKLIYATLAFIMGFIGYFNDLVSFYESITTFFSPSKKQRKKLKVPSLTPPLKSKKASYTQKNLLYIKNISNKLLMFFFLIFFIWNFYCQLKLTHPNLNIYNLKFLGKMIYWSFSQATIPLVYFLLSSFFVKFLIELYKLFVGSHKVNSIAKLLFYIVETLMVYNIAKSPYFTQKFEKFNLNFQAASSDFFDLSNPYIILAVSILILTGSLFIPKEGELKYSKDLQITFKTLFIQLTFVLLTLGIMWLTCPNVFPIPWLTKYLTRLIN